MHTHIPTGKIGGIALALVGVIGIGFAAWSLSHAATRSGVSHDTQLSNREANAALIASGADTTDATTARWRKHGYRSGTSNANTNAPVAPTPLPAPAPTPAPVSATGQVSSVQVTFYGSYDNDPAGSQDISDPVIHAQAGGTGTYADPLTFASPTGKGAYPVGTKIYVPFLQKYFIKEDTCATSWTAPDGCGAVSHVDLYMGNPSNSKAVIACEEALTPGGNATIIVNPSASFVVDSAPLWNQTTGACARTH